MKKSNQGKKHKCKELYFRYLNAEDIVKQTQVNLLTLRYWIHGRTKNDPEGWKFQREQKRHEIIEEQFESNTLHIERVIQMTAQFIEYSLQDRINKVGANGRPIAFSQKEAKAASEVAINLKRLNQLSKGLPTDILNIDVAHINQPARAATVLELREVIKKDPFLIGILSEENNETSNNLIQKGNDDDTWFKLLESSGVPTPPERDSKEDSRGDESGDYESSVSSDFYD